MSVRTHSQTEALRSLETLARNVVAGSRLDDVQLATILDTLHGPTPSPQVQKLITVLRAARSDSSDARRRFFHATRALATGFRAA